MMTHVKCSLCDQFYLARNPKPIGRDGAEYFHRPARSYICFWCADSAIYAETEPCFEECGEECE
jgi:hypothetical protein